MLLGDQLGSNLVQITMLIKLLFYKNEAVLIGKEVVLEKGAGDDAQ